MKPLLFGLLFGTSLMGAIAFAANSYTPKSFSCGSLLPTISSAVQQGVITSAEAEGIWQECLLTYPEN